MKRLGKQIIVNYKSLLKIILLLVFGFIHFNAISQNNALEIKKRFACASSIDERISLVIELCSYYSKTNLVKSDSLLRILVRIIENNNIQTNHSNLYALANLLKSVCFDYDATVKYIKKAYNVALSENNPIYIDYESWLAYFYFEMGENEIAFRHIKNAISSAENAKLEQKLPFCYLVMAFIYRNIGDLQQSEQYFYKTLEVSQRTGDSTYVHYAIHELGNVFTVKGEAARGLVYQKKALEIRKKMNEAHILMFSYNDLANTFLLLDSTERAIEYYIAAIDLAKDCNDKWTLFVVYNSLYSIYFKKADWKKTVHYFQLMKNVVEQVNTLSAYKIYYEAAYMINKQRHKYKQALADYENFIIYKDSISSDDIKKRILELDLQYESLKNDTLLREKQNQITIQKIVIRVIIIGLLIIIVFTFIILKQYKDKLHTYNILEDQNEEIKRQNATKDRLFSIISHDLRGPIGGFKTMVEMMLSDIDTSDKGEIIEFLKVIKHSTTSTFDLLNNLLLWAKSQLNEIIFNPEDNILKALVDRSKTIIEETALNKNIRIHNKISEDLTVYGDTNMLMIIFRNLISNAIKFTQNGKNIIIEAVKSEDKIIIKVIDEGVGIRPENLKNLFNTDIIFRSTGTLNENGTGLGLILCKEFINRHHGYITVESELGRGSIFSVILPERF